MRFRLAVIGASLAALVLPGAAQANIYQQVQATYERDGEVPACMFSSAQLNATLSEEDTYGQQYFADFTDAVQAALAAQASGDCSHRAVAARRHSRLTAGGRQGSLPTSVTSPTQSGVPGPIVLMGAIALTAALVAGMGGAVRLSGWEPGWAVAWRHALAEAGYRLGGRWEDARDRWRR